MAVGTYALCTLAELKAHLGITTSTDDAIMEAYIDEATARIEAWIGRRIVSRSYVEWYGGNNVRAIALRQYPVGYISGVYTGFASAFTVRSTVATDLRLTLSVNPEAIGSEGSVTPSILIARTDASGNITTTSLNYTTYSFVSSMVAAINALTGVAATTVTDMRCALLHPRAGANVKEGTVTISAANVGGEYTFDARTGVVTVQRDPFPTGRDARFPSPPLSTLIEYTAGYVAVPVEIRSACKIIASSLFLSRRADISVASESLGDYSYTRATGDTAHGIMQELLANWREIR